MSYEDSYFDEDSNFNQGGYMTDYELRQAIALHRGVPPSTIIPRNGEFLTLSDFEDENDDEEDELNPFSVWGVPKPKPIKKPPPARPKTASAISAPPRPKPPPARPKTASAISAPPRPVNILKTPKPSSKTMGKAIDSPNPWVAFVARMAPQFGLTYQCAVTDQRIKDLYKTERPPSKPRAPRKPRASKAKPISYDMPPAPYGAKQPSSLSASEKALNKAKRADAANRAMALMKGAGINKVTDLATAKFPRRRRLKKMSDAIDPRSPEARGWTY